MRYHDNCTILHHVTLGLGLLYATDFPGFQARSVRHAGVPLTIPSERKEPDSYDNVLGNLIVHVGDCIESPPSATSPNGRHYVIETLLGSGTFGQVFRCVLAETYETYAIKIIKTGKLYDSHSNFECRVLQDLVFMDPEDKNHMIRYVDHFRFRGHFCIVTEILGKSVRSILVKQNYRGFTFPIISQIVSQVVDSLCVIHSMGLIHGDIKTDNILIDGVLPHVRLADFGSSVFEKQASIRSYIQSRHTRAPEIILGGVPTCAIDIWSVGCLAFELLCGLPLFPGTDEHNMLKRMIKMNGNIPSHLIEQSQYRYKFFRERTLSQSSFKLLSDDEFTALTGIAPIAQDDSYIHHSLERTIQKRIVFFLKSRKREQKDDAKIAKKLEKVKKKENDKKEKDRKERKDREREREEKGVDKRDKREQEKKEKDREREREEKGIDKRDKREQDKKEREREREEKGSEKKDRKDQEKKDDKEKKEQDKRDSGDADVEKKESEPRQEDDDSDESEDEEFSRHLKESPEALSFIQFIRLCLVYEPEHRLTAVQAARHPFLVNRGYSKHWKPLGEATDSPPSQSIPISPSAKSAHRPTRRFTRSILSHSHTEERQMSISPVPSMDSAFSGRSASFASLESEYDTASMDDSTAADDSAVPETGSSPFEAAENAESDAGAQPSFEGVRANVSINPGQAGEHPSAFSVVAPAEKKRKFAGSRSGHSRSVSAPRIGEKHYRRFDPRKIVKRIGRETKKLVDIAPRGKSVDDKFYDDL
ncbi:putative serine/threonine protein kinase [Blattamonas nauphoetae]|uniref:Serine/threonine protein kinase n=1 Tax=Blattamonas nauphoetae TaxID=2049346 RepID=A0ABQ9YKD9_9EUKA|nr:putative serine/threonine protein kinase [Blattamonas nauphoetae]